MRVLPLVLLAISLSEAQGQEMPAAKEIVEKDLADFSASYYPSFKVEYLKIWSFKGFSFEYWDQDNPAYSCEAMYFGSSGQVLLVHCLDQANSTWPPTVRYHAFIKHDDKLIDSKQDIFPIREIFDQLQGFVVDGKKVESLLSQETDNPTLHDFVEFEWGEDNSLLVSIRSIEGVIEGAAYASTIWNEKQNSFVIED